MTENRNHILLVTTIGGKGSGFFSRPYLMARQMKNLDLDFVAVTFGLPIPELEVSCFDIPLGHPLRFSKPNEILKASLVLSKIVEIVKPNVIYAHQPANLLATVMGCHASGIPVVGDLHSLYSFELSAWGKTAEAWFLRLVEDFCVRATKRLTVASDEIKKILVDRGISPFKIEVVPNCIDTDEFYLVEDKSLLREKLGLAGTGELVAFTAPRAFYSNVLAIKHLYQVAMLLETRLPDLRFLILGGGPVITPMPRNIEYTGFVSDLNAYLNACDLAIAPYPREAVCGGARNKILEYWACGLPLVSTREGLRGLGDPLQLPSLVCSDDPQGIADAIVTLANDRFQRKMMSQTARALVVREYDWRALTHRLGAALSDFLAQE